MKPIVTFWRNLLDPSGEQRELTWAALFRRFESAEPYRGDNDQPGWSPARFEPCQRGLENVREVSALCLDYDQCESIETVSDRFSDFYGLVHTTRKHTPEAPRCRVILPLSRAVSRFEFGELWKRVRPFAGAVDEAAKDASRFWFLPGPKGDGEYRTVQLDGRPLDADAWLSKADPTLSGMPIRHPERRDLSAVERRASAYLARMPASIEGQGGDDALWHAALALHGFGLDERGIANLLWAEFNPRCSPPWDRKRIEYKAGQAARSRLPEGFKLDDDREAQWSPERSASWSVEPPPGRFEDDDPVERQPGEDQAEPATPEPRAPRVLTVREILEVSMLNAMSRDARAICTTGNYKLDRITGGIRPGFSWLVGADTSWGKSSWLVSIADENIRLGRRVLIVSSEDTEDVYGDRLMVRRARVDALRYRDRRLTRDEMAAVTNTAEKAEAVPVFCDARRWPIEDLAPHLTRIIRDERIDVVAFDYIQEFRSKRRWQDERVKFREIASVCRHIAKDAKVAGILFSQLTLDDRSKIPTRLNIRECRDIANASEVIIIGFEPDTDVKNKEGVTIIEAGAKAIYVDKVKNGPRGAKLELPWDKTSACFEIELDPEQVRLEQEAKLRDDLSADFEERYP